MDRIGKPPRIHLLRLALFGTRGTGDDLASLHPSVAPRRRRQAATFDQHLRRSVDAVSVRNVVRVDLPSRRNVIVRSGPLPVIQLRSVRVLLSRSVRLLQPRHREKPRSEKRILVPLRRRHFPLQRRGLLSKLPCVSRQHLQSELRRRATLPRRRYESLSGDYTQIERNDLETLRLSDQQAGTCEG